MTEVMTEGNVLQCVRAEDVAWLNLEVATTYGPSPDDAQWDKSFTAIRRQDKMIVWSLKNRIAALELQEATDEVEPIAFIEMSPVEAQLFDNMRFRSRDLHNYTKNL